MKLPLIDIAKLPDLETLTAMFGRTKPPGHDDTIIVIATVVYDSGQSGGGLI